MAVKILRGAVTGIVLAAVLTAPTGLAAQTYVQPFVEASGTVDGDFGGRTIVYPTVAAGVAASVETRRLRAQIDYRLDYRFDTADELSREIRHSGIARAELEVAPDRVTVEAGALASFFNNDYRLPAQAFPDARDTNSSQTYTLYASPRVRQPLAGDIELNGSYRIGYVRTDNLNGLAGMSRPGVTLPPGQLALDRYTDSVNHSVDGRIGNSRASAADIAWWLGGQYQDERVARLDQRNKSYNALGDVAVRLNSALALLASAGYEAFDQSEREVLRGADDLPVVDARGRYVADPSGARRKIYDQDGFIWDAGFTLRPGRRTELTLRAGRRYGGTTVTGNFAWQPRTGLAVRGSLVDGVQSFGRLLTIDLDGLPISFIIPDNPMLAGVGGCYFGVDVGTGGCIANATQSITTATFRNRTGTVSIDRERGDTRMGLVFLYNQRDFLDRRLRGQPQAGANLSGLSDKSYTLTGFVNRKLGRAREVNGQLFVSRFNSGLTTGLRTDTAGIAGEYRVGLGSGLQASAIGALRYMNGSNVDDRFGASIRAVVRYTFGRGAR